MKSTPETGLLTIAAIRESKDGSSTEYLFNEKQAIFTLRPTSKLGSQAAQHLQAAFRQELPVSVRLDSRRGVIQSVKLPSSQEVDEFRRLRPLLEKPDKARRVDLNSIDPTTFNLVDRYLKFKTFRLCANIIPNYKTAKVIFDFCAKQSCHLPGPYDIAPCIPFQYVRDGCYARAHKMRWIITTKYHYCCDKVFSFANQGNDTLAVRADKWGGCCVTWWYHVAPLIRVRLRLGALSITLAMVVDPSMFNKPVLLSTWLWAQENAACNSSAHVSMYSIQPGSAYAPANYTGTAFSTDPAYTATDATLTGYSGLTTCP